MQIHQEILTVPLERCLEATSLVLLAITVTT